MSSLKLYRIVVSNPKCVKRNINSIVEVSYLVVTLQLTFSGESGEEILRHVCSCGDCRLICGQCVRLKGNAGSSAACGETCRWPPECSGSESSLWCFLCRLSAAIWTLNLGGSSRCAEWNQSGSADSSGSEPRVIWCDHLSQESEKRPEYAWKLR